MCRYDKKDIQVDQIVDTARFIMYCYKRWKRCYGLLLLSLSLNFVEWFRRQRTLLTLHVSKMNLWCLNFVKYVRRGKFGILSFHISFVSTFEFWPSFKFRMLTFTNNHWHILITILSSSQFKNISQFFTDTSLITSSPLREVVTNDLPLLSERTFHAIKSRQTKRISWMMLVNKYAVF